MRWKRKEKGKAGPRRLSKALSERVGSIPEIRLKGFVGTPCVILFQWVNVRRVADIWSGLKFYLLKSKHVAGEQSGEMDKEDNAISESKRKGVYDTKV